MAALRTPAEQGISDFSRWFTILSFLSLLPDVAEQHRVLRRRLAFLEAPPASSMTATRRCADQVTDPYRRGMLLTARALSRTARAWLHETLDASVHGRVLIDIAHP
ncbi:hypothetical protein [Amycolatopsis vastitatis]|uniref:hypothetical protein n=1 Tax=Amycolatopsis vastitatis TaxID=1905142 RepID=UPI00196A62B9|nr:hypothetical protein [Amycolatopsis vastitatis]